MTIIQVTVVRTPDTLLRNIIEEYIRDRTGDTFSSIPIWCTDVADLGFIILLECIDDGLVLFGGIGEVDNIGGIQISECVDWFLT